MGRFKVLVAVWVVVTTVCVIRQSVMLRETHDTIREMVSFQGAVVSVIQSVDALDTDTRVKLENLRVVEAKIDWLLDLWRRGGQDANTLTVVDKNGEHRSRCSIKPVLVEMDTGAVVESCSVPCHRY